MLFGRLVSCYKLAIISDKWSCAPKRYVCFIYCDLVLSLQSHNSTDEN